MLTDLYFSQDNNYLNRMGDKIQFDPAYQRVDLIDEEDRQVMAAEKGKREFKEFMDKRDN